MGTTVVSGSGTAVVVETGTHTYLSSLAKTIGETRVRTSFDKAANSVTALLLRFMLVMAPLVFLINGIVKHNWAFSSIPSACYFALHCPAPCEQKIWILVLSGETL